MKLKKTIHKLRRKISKRMIIKLKKFTRHRTRFSNLLKNQTKFLRISKLNKRNKNRLKLKSIKVKIIRQCCLKETLLKMINKNMIWKYKKNSSLNSNPSTPQHPLILKVSFTNKIKIMQSRKNLIMIYKKYLHVRSSLKIHRKNCSAKY